MQIVRISKKKEISNKIPTVSQTAQTMQNNINREIINFPKIIQNDS